MKPDDDPSDKREFIDAADVLGFVAAAFDIESGTLIAPPSTPPQQYLRNATIWLVDQHTALNRTQIAELFNDTTVNILRSIEVFEQYAATNRDRKRRWDDLAEMIVGYRGTTR